MKAMFFLILSTAIVGSQDFGGYDSGKWLSVPDDYVWPAIWKESPVFDPESRKVSELPEELQLNLDNQWRIPGDPSPESVLVDAVDLNGDGKSEYLVRVPRLGGPAGPVYVVFTPKVQGYGYTVIGEVQGWKIDFPGPRENGWLLITGKRRIAPGVFERYLMAFGKTNYDFSRVEEHDFIAQKATVRKTKAEQGGAEQPATAPELKPEGDSKPQSESVGRSQ